MRNRVLCAEEVRSRVYGEDGIPIRCSKIRHLMDALKSGVLYEHVESTQLLYGAVNEVTDAFFLRHVDCNEMGPDFLSRLLASFFVNVPNDDFRPFVDEALRRFLADVTYSPSDDDSLSLKSIRHMTLHSLALWNNSSFRHLLGDTILSDRFLKVTPGCNLVPMRTQQKSMVSPSLSTGR